MKFTTRKIDAAFVLAVITSVAFLLIVFSLSRINANTARIHHNTARIEQVVCFLVATRPNSEPYIAVLRDAYHCPPYDPTP